MRCEKIETCAFFNLYKNRFGDLAYQSLLSAYCEGVFQPLCKRLKYIKERGEEPPLDLCPDGYQAGTGNKIYS
jgi:hypothetical protein